jgi:hypothetical protein
MWITDPITGEQTNRTFKLVESKKLWIGDLIDYAPNPQLPATLHKVRKKNYLTVDGIIIQSIVLQSATTIYLVQSIVIGGYTNMIRLNLTLYPDRLDDTIESDQTLDLARVIFHATRMAGIDVAISVEREDNTWTTLDQVFRN